jgi:hypothetical protein
MSTFSYDLHCLRGEAHALAETLDGLTNNENKASSFYMRALFWIFPSILYVGKKGQMIRESKKELGDIASRMWKNAKAAHDVEGKSLMALMRSLRFLLLSYGLAEIFLSKSRRCFKGCHQGRGYRQSTADSDICRLRNRVCCHRGTILFLRYHLLGADVDPVGVI